MKSKLGYHFIAANGKLGFTDNRFVLYKPGRVYALGYKKRRPQVCYQGMHASSSIAEAAKYGKGTFLCRVKVGGRISDFGEGQFCGDWRQILKFVNAKCYMLEACTEHFKYLNDGIEVPNPLDPASFILSGRNQSAASFTKILINSVAIAFSHIPVNKPYFKTAIESMQKAIESE